LVKLDPPNVIPVEEHGGCQLVEWDAVRGREVEVQVRQVSGGSSGASIVYAPVRSTAETGGKEGEEISFEDDLTFEESFAVGSDFQPLGQFGDNLTRVVVQGLCSGVVYGWRVRVVQLGGGAPVCGPFSNVAEAEPEPTSN
jgi:hypothetical protein